MNRAKVTVTDAYGRPLTDFWITEEDVSTAMSMLAVGDRIARTLESLKHRAPGR